MSIGAAAASNAAKTFYTPTRVETMTQKDFPFVGMIRKRTDLVGSLPGAKAFVNVMIAGNGSSGSSSIGNAITNSGFPPLGGFQIFSAQDYVAPTLDMATVEAMGDNRAAFFNFMREAIDAGLRESAQAQALNCVGDGTGSRGTVGTVLSSTQIQLTDVAQNVNFQASVNSVGGTVVQFGWVSSGVWQLRTSGQSTMLSGVDPTTGILTASAGFPTDVVATDIIVRAGDLPAGTPWNNGMGTTSGARFAGLAGYIPLTKPKQGGNDSFGGFNRATNPWKFAGGYFNGVGKSATDALNLALGAGRSQGAKPNICLVNNFTWAMIESDLEGRRSYDATPDKIQGAGSIGFDSISVRMPGMGRINLVCDNTLKTNLAYLLQLDTFTLWSMAGAHVRILDYPGYGAANIPGATTDTIQTRIGTRGALLECSAPGNNLLVQLK